MTKEQVVKSISSRIDRHLSCIPALKFALINTVLETIEKLPDLFEILEPYHNKKKKEMRYYYSEKETSYNIYEDLSINNKFIEIEHSKIIKKILDKSNNVVGNYKHLQLLENILMEKNIFVNGFDENYIVEREKRLKNSDDLSRIDVFIYEKKKYGKCIIIENKITGKAGDMDNQLARYYKIAEHLDKQVVAIIYLPFYYKYPPIRNYFGEYKEYVEKIKRVLAVIPAIDPIQKKDFVHGFLDKCVTISDNCGNKTAAVCIEQYSNFLKSQGALKIMAKNTDNLFLEKLLADESTMNIVEDIVEIWEKKDESINEILLEQLKENSFFDKNGYMLKEFETNSNACIFFGLDGDEFQIGFHHKKRGFSELIIDELKKILSSATYKGHIPSFGNGDKEWVYGVYNKKKLLGTYEKMFNELLRILNGIQNEAIKIDGILDKPIKKQKKLK
jgi:hypothetical protein